MDAITKRLQSKKRHRHRKNIVFSMSMEKGNSRRGGGTTAAYLAVVVVRHAAGDVGKTCTGKKTVRSENKMLLRISTQN